MQGKLILPPNYPETKGAIVFLAGPITGAPEWQTKAIEYFKKNAPEINVASPRRKIKVKTEVSCDDTDVIKVDIPKTARVEFEGYMFEEQVDWETHYLRKAGKNGVVMFWLAKEAIQHPQRAYARTTRFELGEWKMQHEHNGAKLAVGIELGFTGSRYIGRRLAQDCPKVNIQTTLENTCDEVIRLVRKDLK